MDELAPERHTVVVEAPAHRVWAALTDPTSMARWMAEPEVGLVVTTDWVVGSPIRMTGNVNGPFTNTGTVLRFDPPVGLGYTYRSSKSRVDDDAEHDAIVDIALSPDGPSTTVTVTVERALTSVIRHHLVHYWGVALAQLRQVVEG
jgi:uncharacterized protein YndB with AHSA1/START domain